MARFDLMSLASIALLALAIFEAYRNWNRKGLLLSLLLLVLSLLQVALLLQFIRSWGHFSVQVWIAILAGMIACTALGLLNMNLATYAESAALLIILISLLQLVFGSGILKLP